MCTATLSSCSLLKAFDSEDSGYNINTEEFKNMLEAKAVQYMKDKYNINCSMITYEMGMDYSKPLKEQTYFAVSMKLESISEKPDGYESLKYTNNRPENEDHAFYVYIGSSTEVIGDQYMWYLIYPSLNQMFEDVIGKYAPCKTAVAYTNVSNYLIGGGLYSSFFFSADMNIPDNEEQLKDYLGSTTGTIYFCLLESGDSNIERWNELKEVLKAQNINYIFFITTLSNENFETALKTQSIINIEHKNTIRI